MTTPSPDTAGTPAADQAAPDTGDRLLTLNEAADYLAVSRSFIKKCIYETRTLPAVRIGSMTRVWLSDVRAMITPVQP